METLLRNPICHVMASEDALTADLKQLRGMGFFCGFVAACGSAGMVLLLWDLWRGEAQNPLGAFLTASLLLLWFIGAGLYGLRWSMTQWGEVTIRADTLRWTRKDTLVGTWPVDQITTIKRRRELFGGSSRLRLDRNVEYVLEARTASGARVRLAIGYPEELDATEAWVRQHWERQREEPPAPPS